MSTNQQTAAQPIDLEPVARVDRIISASGLAEVSVFLESALKVGTVFYAAAAHAAAAPSAEQATPLGDLWIHEDMDRDAAASAMNAPRKDLKAAHKQAVDDVIYWRRLALTAEASTGAAAKTEQPPSGNTGEVAASVKTWQERSDEAMHTETWYPPGHYKDLEIADLRAQLARQRQVAPHAQAEPAARVERIDSIAFEKGERAFKSRKPRGSVPYNGDALRTEWFAGYDFAARKTESWRTDLYNEGRRLIAESGLAAPVPQEAEQAAPAAVMVAPEWIEGAIEGVEILDQLIDSVEKHGNYSQETTIGFLNQVRQCFSDIRALAAQPAAPAVTDAARDVLGDAKGGVV